MRAALSIVLAATVATVSSVAGAQDLNTTAAQPATATSTGGSVTDLSGATDHSRVVGRLGLRYFGSLQVPVLSGAGATLPLNGSSGQTTDGTSPPQDFSVNINGNNVSFNALATTNVRLHTIGARYWLSSALGIDVGLSFGFASGSRSGRANAGGGEVTASNDSPNYFGFGIQAGLPIVVAEGKHVTIHIDPMLSFHYAGGSIGLGSTAMDAVDNSSSSILFSIGGQAVAELQFGFLGIPELALQAQFGLMMSYRSASTSSLLRVSNTTTSVTDSGFGIGTTLGPNYGLADIISGSLSAVWYFGAQR